MILIKIVVAATMVYAITWLSERVGPRLAAVVAGIPYGVAINVGFLGIEQGPEFASAAAVSSLGGLSATMVFCIAYWQAASRLGRFNALLTTVAGVIAYVAAAAAFRLLPQELVPMSLLMAASIAGCTLLFRLIEERRDLVVPITITPAIVLGRMGIAVVVVLLITELAHLIGPTWAGLLSGFPMMLLPVLLVLHVTYGPAVAIAIVKHFPVGMVSPALCAVTASLVMVPLGALWGLAASVAVSTGYLALAIAWARRRRAARPPSPA